MVHVPGIVLSALVVHGLAAQVAPEDRPQELGAIAWERDFDAALTASERSGRPVLLLFQEVPG